MVTYYAVMSALAAINLFVFLMLFREKKLNYYILALLAIITVSNTGNFFLATANSIEEAVIAKKCFTWADVLCLRLCFFLFLSCVIFP